ncbi:hypothetical protein HDU96_002823 [Phlyctochytrium bullatum]|nr:hypothetical protein HDU96_002823 [Phlyctochytrium bullatum]
MEPSTSTDPTKRKYLGETSFPAEIVLHILGHLHPNDTPILASVNRHLRQTIPAVLDYNAAERGIRITSLNSEDGTGSKSFLESLRRIHFHHSALFMYSAAVIGIHGISESIAEILWGEYWDEHSLNNEARQMDQVRMIKLALDRGTWPNPLSRSYQEDLQSVFRIAALLHSMDLLDILRRKFLKNNHEDLGTLPMRSFFFSSARAGFADGLSLIPINDPVFAVRRDDGVGIMHLAVASKHPIAVLKIIEKGALMTALSTASSLQGQLFKIGSPLHAAISENAPEIIRLLLENGADTEALDLYRETPLHRAVSEGHMEAARMLLKVGAATNPINCEGRGPIHLAAASGRCVLLSLMLDSGVKVDAKDVLGQTALAHACRGGHVDAVKLLIKKGVSIDTVTGLGSVLHSALACKKLEILQLMVDAGAPLDQANRYGMTPLHCAFSMRSAQKAKVLLSAGANPNIRDPRGRTALHILVERLVWCRPVAEILTLMEDREIDLNAVDADGSAVLHVAATRKRKEIMLWLLARTGIDTNARDGNGKTWLELALASGMKEWLEENSEDLASAGVDISKQS